MAFPLLAKLGLALVASKMQNDEARKQHQRAQQQQLDQTLASIANKRASRAGDSGYMQTAMSGMDGGPSKPRSVSGPMLTQLGVSLMSQDPEPKAAAAPEPMKPMDWAGGDWDDEDKFRNMA